MTTPPPSSSLQKQKALAASLTLSEKLDSIPALLTVLGNTLFALFSGLYRSPGEGGRPESFYRHVQLTGVRTYIRRTTVRQQLYLLPPTDTAYTLACTSRKTPPKSLILSDGTRAHWIGNPASKKIVVNFHGGGYTVPASREMVEFMFQVVEGLNGKGRRGDGDGNEGEVACLFLSYDLAPTAPYPRQLQQAAILLNHVLDELKIRPEDVVLVGDSAGANLVMSLLSHVSHPHPDRSIPQIKSLTKPLKGAVLVSPWVSFDITSPSFKTNAYRDCITADVGKKWSTAFMGCPWPHTERSDFYSQAITAPAEWWTGLKVESVLVTGGEEEMLLDGIREFAGKLQEGLGEKKVEVLIAKGEYHDQLNIDLQIGLKEKDEGESAKMVKSWIASKL